MKTDNDVRQKGRLSEALDRHVRSRHCPDNNGWVNGKPFSGADSEVNGQNMVWPGGPSIRQHGRFDVKVLKEW